jgi:hypothetical protein
MVGKLRRGFRFCEGFLGMLLYPLGRIYRLDDLSGKWSEFLKDFAGE